MHIHPIHPLAGCGCEAPKDRQGTKGCSLTHHHDWQHHSLAWLDQHCQETAHHLRMQMAQQELIRQAALAQQPIDIWLQTPPMDDLKVTAASEDAYDSRPLLSDAIAHEEEDELALDLTQVPVIPPVALPAAPEIDETLIPAGVLAVASPKQSNVDTQSTESNKINTKQTMPVSWLLRVSMLVLLCMVVEGLLAKWALT